MLNSIKKITQDVRLVDIEKGEAESDENGSGDICGDDNLPSGNSYTSDGEKYSGSRKSRIHFELNEIHRTTEETDCDLCDNKVYPLNECPPENNVVDQNSDKRPTAQCVWQNSNYATLQPPLITQTFYRSSGSSENGSNDDLKSPSSRTFEELTGGLPPDSVKDVENSLYFKDGNRRIDLILVYEEEDLQKGVLNQAETLRILDRNKFQENLMREGLELETENKDVFSQSASTIAIVIRGFTDDIEGLKRMLTENHELLQSAAMKETSYDLKTCFVKVHVPYDIVIKYAKILHMKRPLKRFLSISVDAWEGNEEETEVEYNTVCFPLYEIFRLHSRSVENDPMMYTSVFGHDHEDQLLIKERERYFTSAQRSQIVWHILLKTKYGADNNQIGIRKLLQSGAYLSAFPLHEGRHDKDSPYGVLYDRRLLYLEWSNPSRWYKYQPLWLVRKYFGDKIALYFAWLGFYTNMLILPSIVGLCCFIYGLASMNSSENIPSKEICDSNTSGDIVLCPLCDTSCKYQRLGDSCFFSNITYLFDNPSTVFFSIFMSFWATSFLEMWKRRQAVIAWQWDLQLTVEDEETRPEYDTSAKMYKINPVTRRKEPFIPAWKKILRVVISTAVVLAMVSLVLCAVVATIIIRLSLYTFINDSDHDYVKKHAKVVTAIIAALMNLILIMMLTKIYHYVAIWLTNKENPRTDGEFEKSFIMKIFLFEFMNYYSSLIYIAFFKGRFFTHPADTDSRSSLLLRLKGDICDPAGCLSELCIQLAIIMIGKQCFNNVLELGFPAIRNWWRSRSHKIAKKDPNKEYTHWESNYNLQDPGKLALFEEYLEMVIQYGFVTLFVAAFPLAPLFALLNNICEIRLDAYKMVAQARRPMAERVENIGAWFSVLQGITYCAVAFNAFVIAYTSDYIPRKIYQYFYSANNDLVGYIDSSLSVFNTSDYVQDTRFDKRGKGMRSEPETCQYRGYRNGPDDANDPYGLSLQYWHIFAARLLFVIIFEHFVFCVTALIANVIPNVPHQIGRQIQLEKLLTKETTEEQNDKRTNNNNNNNGSGGKYYDNDGETYQPDDDYDELISTLRDSRNSAKLGDIIRRKNFGGGGRKISRQSIISIRKPSMADENDVQKF